MVKYLGYIFLLATCLMGGKVFAQVPAQKIVPFTLYDMSGKAFTDKNIPKDKLTFFLFIDPGCEHCQKAIGNYNKNYESFKQTNIYIISETNLEVLLLFLAKYAPRLSQKKNVTLLEDKKNTFITTFQPIRYPGMFLYDKDGKLLLYEDNEETIFRFVNFLKKEKDNKKEMQ